MLQIEISKETGLKPSEISRIIRGQRTITWRQAVILSETFGHSARWWIQADIKEIAREIRKAA